MAQINVLGCYPSLYDDIVVDFAITTAAVAVIIILFITRCSKGEIRL